MIYWPQVQRGGVRACYCAPVHWCAVKWSQNTKWKMTVDRLFTSRHQASFKMGLIASPCSWSWFKVLTSISWCPACCRDMFQKDLSTATESAVTLSTVRGMMYFTKKRDVIFDLPRPLPPKVPDRTASKYSPSLGPNGNLVLRAFPLKIFFKGKALGTRLPKWLELVPVVARGIVTGLTNYTVHQWQFSSIRSPFSLARSRCVHLL